MEIFPAIDLLKGKVVRLKQGNYLQKTVYELDPINVVNDYSINGANNIHIVDLDGAKDGKLSNFDLIKQLVTSSDMFVEVGGGIRDQERIEKYLNIGVKRVILGTIAIKNIDFVKKMVKLYGDRIAVGVDSKNGFVAINGWKEITSIKSIDFVKQLRDMGVSTVIYTDISKDGLESGTNLKAYMELSLIDNINIIASGGITYYYELAALNDMGIHGVIIGKALFNKTLDLKKIINASN